MLGKIFRFLVTVFNMEINVLKKVPKPMGCLCWSRWLELCIALCLKRPSLYLLDSLVQEVWAICCRLEYFLHYWLEKAWGALCATFYQCLTDQAFSCLIHFFERCVSDLLLSYRSGHKLWQNPSKIGSSLKACSSALESPNSNWSTHEAPSVLQLQTLFSSLLRQRSVEAGNEQKRTRRRTRALLAAVAISIVVKYDRGR